MNTLIIFLLLLLPSLNQAVALMVGSFFIGLILRLVVEIGLPWYYFRKMKRSLISLFRPVPIKDCIIWCLLTAGVVSAVLIAITHLIDVDNIITNLSGLYEVTVFVYLFVALSIGLINPFLEEIFWRGFLYGQTKVMWTGAFFGLHHIIIFYTWVPLSLVILGFILLGVVGVLFNYLYKKYDSLVIPLCMHIVADIVIVIYGYFLLF